VLAKDLYKTGNADAMYLAGLIADDDKMTAEELDWVVHFLRYKKVNLPYTGKLK
jgi:hypothetical protein